MGVFLVRRRVCPGSLMRENNSYRGSQIILEKLPVCQKRGSPIFLHKQICQFNFPQIWESVLHIKDHICIWNILSYFVMWKDAYPSIFYPVLNTKLLREVFWPTLWTYSGVKEDKGKAFLLSFGMWGKENMTPVFVLSEKWGGLGQVMLF